MDYSNFYQEYDLASTIRRKLVHEGLQPLMETVINELLAFSEFVRDEEPKAAAKYKKAAEILSVATANATIALGE